MNIASFLQGSNSPLQGGSPILQGSAPYLQGSSPALQVTKDPSTLPSTTPLVVRSAAAIPAPPVSTPAPVNPNATPAPAVVDKSNDINQNLSALDATKSLLSGGLSSIKSSLARLFGNYDTEANTNSTGYNDQSTVNKSNFLRNTQSALASAAQGRQSLFRILAQLGALNGSGVNLANNAVQAGANADISGANETFGTNQTGLDSAFGLFKTADQQRREEAQRLSDESEQDLRAKVAGNQQSIYGNLSNDYAEMGDKENAKTYSDLLASLFPSIAANSVPAGAPTYSPAGYTPPSLSTYASGGSTVKATPSAGISGLPGLSAYIAPTKRKTI